MNEGFLGLEQAHDLVEVLRSNGVKGFCFDFDDTLIHTQPMFKEGANEFCAVVSELYGLDCDELVNVFHSFNMNAFRTHGVQFSRWEAIIANVQAHYGLPAEVANHLPILMSIYQKTPIIKPGVVDFLDFLKYEQFKIGLVTHADIDWTHFKLAATGIEAYLDAIVIADINTPKSPIDWQSAVDLLGCLPEEVIAIGDNRIGDIQAAHTAGVLHKVLVPPTLDAYSEGEIPPGTIITNGFLTLPDDLVEYFDS